MSTPLQPRGTLRSRFVPATSTDIFRRIGAGARTCDLGDEGLYLAEELVAADRWLGEADAQALAILVLALMIAQRQGSTRLPLDPSPKGALRTLVGDINRVANLELDVPRVVKTITELTKTGRFTHVIGVRDARVPLVVDDDALYTERTRWLEQRVATRLAARIAAPHFDASKIVDDLVRHPAQRALSDEQAVAVKLALSGKLTVVTGGPGTGKTVVAAAIVRGFARMGIEHVALAAQTGKAANRLTQVIGEQLAALTGIAPRGDAHATGLARSPHVESAAASPHDTSAAERRTASHDASAAERSATSPHDMSAAERSAASLHDLSAADRAATHDASAAERRAASSAAGRRGASSSDLSAADRALAAAPPVAQTLHRLLGYRGGRFAHHAQSPLPVGAVIVDEASMLDLELVDALLDALPASAPLVLIGDAHQLPAIDAGQLLADLAGAESIEVRTHRQPDLFQVAAIQAAAAAAQAPRSEGAAAQGDTVNPSPGARGDDPITARVAVLAKSFRMDTSDVHGRAVYDAAQAVHDGSAHRLTDKSHPLATPRTPGTLRFLGVEWVDTAVAAAAKSAAAPAPAATTSAAAASSSGAISSSRAQDVTLAVATSLWHHFEGPRALRFAEHVFRFADGRVDDAQAAELEQLWYLLGRARILTVTRALSTGSIAINDHVHELALDRLSVTGRPDFVPGEPVMITANDYQRGLFNGDVGIIVRADEGLGRHHYRAIFRVAGELRPFAIEALRDRLELAWALTVHKSQGSELDAVALLLPHDDLPLVTRELIYTGITRARTSVVLCGSRPILTAGAKRRALRHSGLAARLRATLSS